MNPANGGWAIFLSLLVSLLLSVVHLPETWPAWLGYLRPNWMLLVVFFWVVEVPHRVGLIAIWVLGLFVDVLQAEPLGLNGFILASVTYIAWRFYERLRMYSVLQQCVVVLLMAIAAEVLRSVVLGLSGRDEWHYLALLRPMVSMVLWPFLFIVLLRVRTGLRVE